MAQKGGPVSCWTRSGSRVSNLLFVYPVPNFNKIGRVFVEIAISDFTIVKITAVSHLEFVFDI